MQTINTEELLLILSKSNIDKSKFEKFWESLEIINRALEKEFGGTIDMQCKSTHEKIKISYNWDSDMFKINPHYARSRWTREECFLDLFENIIYVVSPDVGSKIEIEIEDVKEGDSIGNLLQLIVDSSLDMDYDKIVKMNHDTGELILFNPKDLLEIQNLKILTQDITGGHYLIDVAEPYKQLRRYGY